MTKNPIIITDCRASYIFGIKEPINAESLSIRLVDKKYRINKTRKHISAPFEILLLNFAKKDDTDIIYEDNKTPTYIGVNSKHIKSVIHEFDMLTSLLHDMDELKIKESQGIEVVITARVFLGGLNASDTLKKFQCGIIENFTKKFQKSYQMENFRISTISDHERESIHIAPWGENQNYLFIQISLRTVNNLERVIDYLENIEGYLNTIFGVLKEG